MAKSKTFPFGDSDYPIGYSPTKRLPTKADKPITGNPSSQKLEKIAKEKPPRSAVKLQKESKIPRNKRYSLEGYRA
jgi:hypothetical protein